MSLLWDFLVRCVLNIFSWNPVLFVINSSSACWVPRVPSRTPGTGLVGEYLGHILPKSYLGLFWLCGLGPELSHKMCPTQCCCALYLIAAAAEGGPGRGLTGPIYSSLLFTCVGLSLRWKSTNSLGLVWEETPKYFLIPSLLSPRHLWPWHIACIWIPPSPEQQVSYSFSGSCLVLLETRGTTSSPGAEHTPEKAAGSTQLFWCLGLLWILLVTWGCRTCSRLLSADMESGSHDHIGQSSWVEQSWFCWREADDMDLFSF